MKFRISVPYSQRLGLNALLEEFTRKLRETGVHLKAADFKDIG